MVASAKATRDVPFEFNVDERPLACEGMSVFSNASPEHGAEMGIAVALDLPEHPDQWWDILRQRLVASEQARLNAADTAAWTITSRLRCLPHCRPLRPLCRLGRMRRSWMMVVKEYR
jgi:hypothetical protein